MIRCQNIRRILITPSIWDISLCPLADHCHKALFSTGHIHPHTRTTCTHTVNTHTYIQAVNKSHRSISSTAEYLMVYRIFYVGAATLISVPLWLKTREGELELRSCEPDTYRTAEMVSTALWNHREKGRAHSCMLTLQMKTSSLQPIRLLQGSALISRCAASTE